MDNLEVKDFFNKHHLRTCEMQSVLKRMEQGVNFGDAMRQEESDWTEAESGDSSESVELEAFRYTVLNDLPE